MREYAKFGSQNGTDQGKDEMNSIVTAPVRGLMVGGMAALFLLTGCALPLKIIDTTANALTKTATTAITTTGDVFKTGAGMVGSAAKSGGAALPLAAALAAEPVAPAFIP